VKFAVGAEEEGRRIDAEIARRAGTSRSVIQEAIRAGDITVDGEVVRTSHRLRSGEVVAGEIPVKEERPVEAEDIPVRLRYSDDRVLVVSKPAGLVVHPAAGHTSGTLVNALLGLGVDLARGESDRPGIVHRLDKGTSGLLLVARDDEAHAFLTAALKRREVARTYLTLVRGEMPADSGTIDAPLGRHPAARRKMAVIPDGRMAVTHYTVLATGEGCSLLEVTLETGRTHQIRVHLAHLRHPVLGDPTYGGRSEGTLRLGLERPFLHAARLRFPHPDDGRPVEVEDPLPTDLLKVLENAEIPAL
jgi:23S rRNA pseudouridine1911/1915/1917 synthase